MKVYDAFLFFNELDLLEIRLNLLNELVDHFVISESDLTFSGVPKPLYYSANRGRFARFQHKIIHQVITDNPTTFSSPPVIKDPRNKDEACLNMIFAFIRAADNFPKNELHWGRDFFQRECLHRALLDCSSDDVILFSDVDEIPDPRTLRQVIGMFPSDSIYTLRQKELNYYLNLYKQDGWMGPRVAQYSRLHSISLNEIRAIKEGGKTSVDSIDVLNGGWHFTSLGGPEMVVQKIESWGHQEFNTARVKKNIRANIESGRDIFYRRGSKSLRRIEIDESVFPKWLVDNKSRYGHLISHGDSAREASHPIRDLFRGLLRR